MRVIKITPGELEAARLTRPEAYWTTIEPALRRNRSGTIVGVNVEHPAYAAAAKLAGVEVDTAPPPPRLCPRCGERLEGGCRRSCRRCGYAEGCGG
jgi:hypothetical protein